MNLFSSTYGGVAFCAGLQTALYLEKGINGWWAVFFIIAMVLLNYFNWQQLKERES
jgi:1,4-dihydroxy-2-naphthoate octaprenyltransferase